MRARRGGWNEDDADNLVQLDVDHMCHGGMNEIRIGLGPRHGSLRDFLTPCDLSQGISWNTVDKQTGCR